MSGITYDYMEEYIRSLLPQNTGALKEMEDYAKQNNIPIVQPETGNFLKLIINIKKPLNILELGTAIGYSSILMSMSAGGRCIVTTIERDTEMVKKAKENISKYGFDKNVNVVEGDCIEVLKSLKGSYDVIFIDAGKAHYNHFLPYCEKVLKEDGIIIADNVLFRGMVAYKDLVKRRKITIVKRMKSYLKLVSEERFITSVIPMGDGIAVTIRGNHMKSSHKKMNKPEILAPAGNLEKLKTAIDFGADAVYLGGTKLNLRAFADNFSSDELNEGIKYAHERGKKVYVTLNVFPHNEDLCGLEDYLKELYSLKADAILVSDPGIIMTAKKVVPDLELHLSTQSNNVNWKTCLFWYNYGVKRIVLARELSLEEIKTIRNNLPEDCELEAFVHGSMCMAYSGRCLLSNYMTGRDSNRGLCAQPCRYKYFLMEEKRPNQYFPVYEDNKGTYILNSKDLCMIKHIPELVNAGINSFKIEGRMKSSFYVAAVVKSYRKALDAYFEEPQNYVFQEKWLDNLLKVSHRAYYTGFYFNDPDKQAYESSSYIRDYDIVGIVRKFDEMSGIAVIEQRNKAYEGDIAEVLSPEGDNFYIRLNDMHNEEGKKIESTPVAQMIYSIKTDKRLHEKDMLIKSKD